MLQNYWKKIENDPLSPIENSEKLLKNIEKHWTAIEKHWKDILGP
jgi:hypothetical protein